MPGWRTAQQMGGGGGTLVRVTSTDGSVDVTNPDGPIVDLSVASGLTWFAKRFQRARALVPAADFDSLLEFEFPDTITVEHLGDVGNVIAIPGNNGSASQTPGGLFISVGDAVIAAPHSTRWAPTGALNGNHVRSMQTKPWYLAALAQMQSPVIPSGATDFADFLGLRRDDNNRVALGLDAVVNDNQHWTLTGIKAGAPTIQQGPVMNNNWALAEMWNDGTDVHAAIDGVEFAGIIPASALADLSATIACRLGQGTNPNLTAVCWDKLVLVSASPVPGSA